MSPGFIFCQEIWLTQLSCLKGLDQVICCALLSLFLAAYSAQPILPWPMYKGRWVGLKALHCETEEVQCAQEKTTQVCRKTHLTPLFREKHHCLISRLGGSAPSASSSTKLPLRTAVRWRGSLSWPLSSFCQCWQRVERTAAFAHPPLQLG